MLEARRWGAVLGAIVDAPRAWSSAADLATVLGWTAGEVDDVLCELSFNGLAESWPVKGVASWTLTPFAAEGLNVWLCEQGIAGRTRWARSGSADAPARAPAPRREAADLTAVPDPGPGPVEIAEAADEADRWKPRGALSVDRLPRPTVILTGSKSTWDEAPARAPGKPSRRRFRCSACLGRKLRPSVYCLRCNRWGMDGVIARTRRAQAAAASVREAG